MNIKNLFRNLLHDAETLSSEAEQNATDYTDSAITEKTQYSTTETAVGTWIDGKTVYRKVFTGTLNNSTTTQVTNDSSILPPNVIPIKTEGILQSGNLTVGINSYLNANYFSGVYWTNSAMILYTSSAENGWGYRLVAYYAK